MRARTTLVMLAVLAIVGSIAIVMWCQAPEPPAPQPDSVASEEQYVKHESRKVESASEDKGKPDGIVDGEPGEKREQQPGTPEGWTLRGRVVGLNGRPLVGARIYTWFEGQIWSGDPRLESLGLKTDAEGMFEGSGLKLQSYWSAPALRPITIIHKDYCWKRLDIESMRGQETVLDLGDVQLDGGADISGYVRTATGAPASGAMVVLGDEHEHYPGMQPRRFWRSPGSHLTSDELRKAGRTDTQGRYRLRGIEPGTYILRAWSDGYAPAVSEPFTVEGLHDKEIDLYLEEGGQVQGKVTYADGTPVPGCRMTVGWEPHLVLEGDKPGEESCVSSRGIMPKHEDGYCQFGLDEKKRKVLEVVHDFFRQTQTDAKGYYRIVGIPAGRDFRVTAVLPGSGGAFSQDKSAKTGARVDFEFLRPARVTVHATDAESGEPLDVRLDLEVLGIPEGGRYPKRTCHKSTEDKLAWECFLEPGKYEIIAWVPGFHEEAKVVKVPRGESTEKIELKLRRAVGKINGCVIDSETGRSLAGIKVHAYEWIRSMGWGSSDEALTGADGSFELHGFLGTYRGRQIGHWVKAGSATYVEKKVEGNLGENDTVEYVIELQKGARITGRIVRLDGRSPVGTRVICKPPHGCFSDWLRVLVKEGDGSFEFGPLGGGSYIVEASGIFESVKLEPGGTAAVTLTIPKQ